MNSLERHRLERTHPGAIHFHVDGSPDDRDDFDYDAGEVPCCMGSAVRGPRGCTCWTPVFDLDQADPDLDAEPSTRTTCCDDCAYRNGSPERADGQDDELQDIAGDGSRFACHKGMRRVVTWEHPDGREITAEAGDYQPPMSGPVAFKADGSPAEYCAGWNAHRRALLGTEA